MPTTKTKGAAPGRSRKRESGDKIAVDNRGNRNAIAAGRHALAAVLNVNIRDLKWQPVVVVLAIVGLLLGTILWFVIPRAPAFMRGQFNIAVADILVQDGNGRPLPGPDGTVLATYIQKQIETEFAGIELNKTIPYEIWGPEQTGKVGGETAEERSNTAAKIAAKIRANILIYGVIVVNGGQSRFVPEFQINYATFRDASEITGEHDMGSPLMVELPFRDSIQAVTNPALAGRVNALHLITIGLAYYSIDNFDQAVQYFQKAAGETRWLESSGKEVVYLLLGNSFVRWASMDDDSQYLPAAMENYTKALSINPDYARGLLGQGNVLYLEALGPLDQVNIDAAKLDRAAAMTQEALTLKDRPESANVEAKVHFNLGQIDLARYQAKVPGDDWVARAKEEFSAITQDYEAGNRSLESLAAHAYFRGGVIAYLQGDKDQAIDRMKKAITIASPFYQAEYTAFMGGIYAALGEKALAKQSYAAAISIAETYAYSRSAAHYQQELDALR